MAELTPTQIKNAIAYYEGTADNLEKRVKLLQERIERGRELGADMPGHQHFEHFKKLVDEWMRDGEQAETYRLSATKLIFKLEGKDSQ